MLDKKELCNRIKNDPCSKSLIELLEILIEESRNYLENANEEEIRYIQGTIKGYRKIIKLLA